MIEIYTDGACKGNPGPGGFGIVIRVPLADRVSVLEHYGYCESTTNNIMELQGVIQALKGTVNHAAHGVTVYTDSRYVVDAFEKHWLRNWKRNHWRKSDGKPVKNLELWKQLDTLCELIHPQFVWVKGHADNEFNNRCDELANHAIHQKGGTIHV